MWHKDHHWYQVKGKSLWKVDDTLCVDFIVISLCIYYLNGLWAWLLIDTKVVICSTIKYPWDLTSWWSHTHTHTAMILNPTYAQVGNFKVSLLFLLGFQTRNWHQLTACQSTSICLRHPHCLPLLREPCCLWDSGHLQIYRSPPRLLPPECPEERTETAPATLHLDPDEAGPFQNLTDMVRRTVLSQL